MLASLAQNGAMGRIFYGIDISILRLLGYTFTITPPAISTIRVKVQHSTRHVSAGSLHDRLSLIDRKFKICNTISTSLYLAHVFQNRSFR